MGRPGDSGRGVRVRVPRLAETFTAAVGSWVGSGVADEAGPPPPVGASVGLVSDVGSVVGPPTPVGVGWLVGPPVGPTVGVVVVHSVVGL
jgi:hypothetical protein